MDDVLLVQNTRSEGSGILGTLLEDDGFKIKSVQAKNESIPYNQYSLIVILGAPESANDDLSYLREEEKLIQNAIKSEIPTLGICLGSQLMAKALDGRVFKGPLNEVGFYSDVKVDTSSKLFAGFSNPTTVFHWHRDTYDLPLGATKLATLKILRTKHFSSVVVLVYSSIWKFLRLWSTIGSTIQKKSSKKFQT